MTTLLYLDDTYRGSAEAVLERVGQDERGTYCVFNETVFYPQGGGQPSDRGVVRFSDVSFDITYVAIDAEEVRHYGELAAASALVGQSCALQLDQARRLGNARAHTAGHLLQSIIDGLQLGLVAVKGYHFPEGPYVEFQGATDHDREQLAQVANQRFAQVIGEGRAIEAKRARANDPEFADLLARLPYKIPADKPLRVVQIDGFAPVPCGGTHLRSLSELGSVRIRKIKAKSGNTQISYVCESTD